LKTLYLLRHAKAAPDSPKGDAARPLLKRGRKAAAAMGELLGGLEARPELILCSPSVRTRETLDLVLPALDPAPDIAIENELYLAPAAALLDRLRRVPDKTGCVLLIGHNPGIHELAARLATDDEELRQNFPTAALAALAVRGAWSELHWHEAALSFLRTPKDLKSDRDDA